MTLDSQQDSQLLVPRKRKQLPNPGTVTPPEKIKEGMSKTPTPPSEKSTTPPSTPASSAGTSKDSVSRKQLQFGGEKSGKGNGKTDESGEIEANSKKIAAAKTKVIPPKGNTGPGTLVATQPKQEVKRSPSTGVADVLNRSTTATSDLEMQSPKDVQMADDASKNLKEGEKKNLVIEIPLPMSVGWDSTAA